MSVSVILSHVRGASAEGWKEVAMGRAHLGSSPEPRYDLVSNKEKCQLVKDEICTEVKESGSSKLVSMWNNFSWAELSAAESLC